MKKLLIVLFLTSSLFAHDEVEEQIELVSRQIAADPENAMLYVQRGELHRLHEDWPAAHADLDRAAKLDPSLTIVHYARGMVELESGRPAAAKVLLDRFLELQPRHSQAHLARARALVRLNQPEAAVADYYAAIASMQPPTPDLYHERAKLLASLGRVDEAIGSLDAARSTLGTVTSLQRLAIDLELAAGRYDGALARVNALAARAQRKEAFLALKGDILAKAGRLEEAQATYRETLALIAALPETHRHSAAVRQLTERLATALEK